MQVQRRLTLAASMQSLLTIVPIELYICTPSGNDPRRLYKGWACSGDAKTLMHRRFLNIARRCVSRRFCIGVLAAVN
jgi:hypothetical protein